jgi:hypothetical protein
MDDIRLQDFKLNEKQYKVELIQYEFLVNIEIFNVFLIVNRALIAIFELGVKK